MCVHDVREGGLSGSEQLVGYLFNAAPIDIAYYLA